MPRIHPTAIVDPRAELADDVQIDAYAIIEGRVIIGAGSRIFSHSVLRGHTILGAKCQVGPAAYVGLDPQHLKFDGSETSLIVGDETVIREGVSLHRAFKPGEEHATRVGQRCFLMAFSHVGHDCRVGDDVVLAHGSMLGGHAIVGDRVFLGVAPGSINSCALAGWRSSRATKGSRAMCPRFPPCATIASKPTTRSAVAVRASRKPRSTLCGGRFDACTRSARCPQP